MPIFYLSTNRIDADTFELVQEKKIGFDCNIRTWQIKETDKLTACLLNIGFCCRYISDKNNKRAVVSLFDDRNDLGLQAANFDLFRVLYSPYYFKRNHKHLEAFYGKKIQWLDKIFDYAYYWQINFWLHDEDKNRIIVKKNELEKQKNYPAQVVNNKQDKTVKRIIKNR